MVAFLDHDRGDAAKALGRDVGIRGGLYLTRSSYDRNQSVLRSDLRRLYRHNALIRLADTDPHNCTEDQDRTDPDSDFLPRLHFCLLDAAASNLARALVTTVPAIPLHTGGYGQMFRLRRTRLATSYFLGT